ncbi:hypothetical protein [Streptomyces hygroscopicus]|uniref:hypothetical protein n=1 Tax=Streptomyces hygroscopicus TaxID=1912 RepID=UPI001FCB708D|nr:hypothetical protein [Streptomyces hygroscopicus]BDH10182.1 hypothetical protein HOK021_13610 [Streptomyces hygroscopicus]
MEENAEGGGADKADAPDAPETVDQAGKAIHADREEFIPIDAKHLAQISPCRRKSGG